MVLEDTKIGYMKKYLLIACALLFATYGNAQDVLMLHNGDSVKGKVIERRDKYITFIYQGEESINTIGVNAIHKIHNQSGRTELLTEKIIVASPKDWENVRVVYDKDEVIGLRSLGQVEKHSSGTWSLSVTAGHFSEKTLKKLRQEAARRGGCIVLVFNIQSQSGSLYQRGHASMTGEIYTY